MYTPNFEYKRKKNRKMNICMQKKKENTHEEREREKKTQLLRK